MMTVTTATAAGDYIITTNMPAITAYIALHLNTPKREKNHSKVQ